MARPTRYTEQNIKEFVDRGYWRSETPWGVLDRNALEYPDKEAFVDGRVRMTWSQAKLWTDRVALGLLELGFTRDEVLANQLPTSVERILLMVACGKAGVLGFPVRPPQLRQSDTEHLLKEITAAGVAIPHVFRARDFVEMVHNIVPGLPMLRHILVAADEVPAGTVSLRKMAKRPIEMEYSKDVLERSSYQSYDVFVRHTTGTTGVPKLVELPIAARMCFSRAYVELLRMTGDDILVCFSAADGGPNAPAFWASWLVSAKMVFLEEFDEEGALDIIQKERGTIICVVPSHLGLLLEHPSVRKYDIRSVRSWHSAGSLLPYEIAVKVEEVLGGKITSHYGGAEWGGTSGSSPDDPRETRFLTVGKPIGGDQVKLVDGSGRELPAGGIGEIWVRGPCSTSGYFRNAAAMDGVWTQDGWCRTGDLGQFDERGNLMIVGRIKDVIIRGGQNVYPAEVENMLLEHDKVAQVSVVPMPDPVLQEKACACVVVRGGQDFSFDEMVDFMKRRQISSYKIPERLEIVDEIPLVGGLKPDKKALAAMVRLRVEEEIRRAGGVTPGETE